MAARGPPELDGPPELRVLGDAVAERLMPAGKRPRGAEAGQELAAARVQRAGSGRSAWSDLECAVLVHCATMLLAQVRAPIPQAIQAGDEKALKDGVMGNAAKRATSSMRRKIPSVTPRYDSHAPSEMGSPGLM